MIAYSFALDQNEIEVDNDNDKEDVSKEQKTGKHRFQPMLQPNQIIRRNNCTSSAVFQVLCAEKSKLLESVYFYSNKTENFVHIITLYMRQFDWAIDNTKWLKRLNMFGESRADTKMC